MYGMRHPDFAATVFNWCDEVNGDKIGFYKIAKGLHMDNFKRNKGMEETGHLINDIEEFDYQDPKSYYAKKHLPPQGFKGKFESVNSDLENNVWRVNTKQPEFRIALKKIKIEPDEIKYLCDFFDNEEGNKENNYIYLFREWNNEDEVYNWTWSEGISYHEENFIQIEVEDWEIEAEKYNL
jgi:hypothetical protein